MGHGIPRAVLFVIAIVVLLAVAVLVDPHHGIGKLFSP
jgi:hypothetical protein